MDNRDNESPDEHACESTAGETVSRLHVEHSPVSDRRQQQALSEKLHAIAPREGLSQGPARLIFSAKTQNKAHLDNRPCRFYSTTLPWGWN